MIWWLPTNLYRCWKLIRPCWKLFWCYCPFKLKTYWFKFYTVLSLTLSRVLISLIFCSWNQLILARDTKYFESVFLFLRKYLISRVHIGKYRRCGVIDFFWGKYVNTRTYIQYSIIALFNCIARKIRLKWKIPSSSYFYVYVFCSYFID